MKTGAVAFVLLVAPLALGQVKSLDICGVSFALGMSRKEVVSKLILPPQTLEERTRVLESEFGGSTVLLYGELFGLPKGSTDCGGNLQIENDRVVEVKRLLSNHTDAVSLVRYLQTQLNSLAPGTLKGAAPFIVWAFRSDFQAKELQSSTNILRLAPGNLPTSTAPRLAIEVEVDESHGSDIRALGGSEKADGAQVWLVLWAARQ